MIMEAGGEWRTYKLICWFWSIYRWLPARDGASEVLQPVGQFFI